MMAAAGAPEPELLRYSSDDLPERERFAIWREVVGPTFLRLEVSQVADHPFRASGTLLALPGLGIQWADNSGIRMERTRGLIGDGSDDLILPLVTAGRHFALQRGRDTVLDARETALLSSGDIGSVSCAAPSQAVVLRLSRASVASAVARLDDMLGQSIPRDSEALRLLVGYVELLRSDATLCSPGLTRLAVAHICDLVALGIGATRDGAELAACGLRAARLRAAKADIAANLESRDLSVTAVAKRQGVTPRYLQMLFEAEGTTFSQFVLNRRLAFAHTMLTDWRRDHLTITAVALAAGFGDLSHFNHSFRRRYGATPRDVRKQRAQFRSS
jgi:AraC-like DNA-binding protein